MSVVQQVFKAYGALRRVAELGNRLYVDSDEVVEVVGDSLLVFLFHKLLFLGFSLQI